jgi:regulator of G-protein signaling
MLSFHAKNRPNTRKVLEKLRKFLKEHQNDQELLKEKVNEQIKKTKEEEDRLRKFEEAFLLSNFIQNKKHLNAFKIFLRNEFSEENLEFIEEVEKFRKLTSDEKRYQKCKEIWSLFIKPKAKMEINMRANIRRLFEDELSNYDSTTCPVNLYDDVVDEVIMSMVDSYYRFQLTNEYKELVISAKSRGSWSHQIFSKFTTE